MAPLVVIFVFPVIGRINPALLLASRIAAAGARVVFTYPTPFAHRLQKAKSRIPQGSTIQLLGFGLDGDPPYDPKHFDFVQEYNLLNGVFPSRLRRYLLDLPEPPSCFISDEVSAPVTNLARELGIPTYILVPQSAFALSAALFTPKLAEESRIPFSFTGAELLPPVEIPSVATVKFSEFLTPYSDRFPAWVSNMFRESIVAAQNSDGLLINTFTGLEPGTLSAVRNEKQLNPRGIPVLEVGPIIPEEDPDENSPPHHCIEFLNRYPPSSVVYVAFGSLRNTTDENEVHEIYEGLKSSGYPFIWMLRCDESWIPERIESGLIVRDWSPQLQILSHPSTGLFLSHCGWNSTIESLTRGVPVLGFPAFMDQHLNVKLVESHGAGMRLPALHRKEIESCVKKVMESKEMRLAAQRLKKSASEVDPSLDLKEFFKVQIE